MSHRKAVCVRCKRLAPLIHACPYQPPQEVAGCGSVIIAFFAIILTLLALACLINVVFIIFGK